MPRRPEPPLTVYRRVRAEGRSPRDARAAVRGLHPGQPILPPKPPPPPPPVLEEVDDYVTRDETKLEIAVMVAWFIIKCLFKAVYIVLYWTFQGIIWIAAFMTGFALTRRALRRD